MPAPSTPGRIHTLDSLRGFALLGILVVNLPYFGHSIYVEPEIVGAADAAVTWLVAALGQVKAFSLFSFLFGYGLAVQMERAAARGEALGPRYARRLVGIFAFGVAHAVLLFAGDVLTIYAALGAVLWAVRGWSPRRLVGLAAASLGIAALGFGALGALTGQGMSGSLDVALAARADAAFAGSFLDAAGQRLRDLPVMLPFLAVYNGPVALAMFALGLAAGKVGVFSEVDRWEPRLRRAVPWALAVAVPGNALYATVATWGVALPTWLNVVGTAGVVVAGPALTFAFLVGVVAAERSGRLAWALRPIRAAGRMSLTNYLGESLLAGFVFCGWGLGLWGEIGAVGCLLLTPVLFGVLVAFSTAWTRRFRNGPLEWLLRSWTYGRWQPLGAPAVPETPRVTESPPVAEVVRG